MKLYLSHERKRAIPILVVRIASELEEGGIIKEDKPKEDE